MKRSYIHKKIRSVKQRLLFFISKIIGPFIAVKPNVIFLWSYSGKNFSCNPAYFTKYLAERHLDEYKLIWLFDRSVSLPSLPSNVLKVRYGSLQHIFYINMAGVVMSNARVENRWALWKKKKTQKYIMTYHASMGVKKVELDADHQYESYIKMAKEDSDRCDLMLSGSGFWSGVMKRSFQYNGEILEAGTPRNDFMFHPELWKAVRDKVNKEYNIPSDYKLVLYAPTFRNDGGLDHYLLDWPSILDSFENKFGGKYLVMFRLHPNMLKENKTASSLIGSEFQSRDLTLYYDIQELLAISDILITDYSSSMFDFALKRLPVFIFADDIPTYNRGTYVSLNTLPFPLATSSEELVLNIQAFDAESYKSRLEDYLSNVVHTFESGRASEALYNWLKAHTTI